MNEALCWKNSENPRASWIAASLYSSPTLTDVKVTYADLISVVGYALEATVGIAEADGSRVPYNMLIELRH